MKVFISVDIEGISGIVDNTMTSRTQGDYEKGRALMVGDVNAAIEGILSVGPAEITVSDAHGGMNNINPEALHSDAILVRARARWRPTRRGSERKLKKYYLIFLVLYLIALILAGANRMSSPDSVLLKAWGVLWSLTPSQNAGWFVISGVVLVILIILVFVAGCKLIAYFMHNGPAEGVQ